MVAVVGALLAGLALQRTLPAFVGTRAILRGTYAGARRAADVLRANAGPRGTVFCDDAAVEVFSSLPSARFVRWSGDNVSVFHLTLATRVSGRALVVSEPRRVTALRDAAATLYEDGTRVVLLWRVE